LLNPEQRSGIQDRRSIEDYTISISATGVCPNAIIKHSHCTVLDGQEIILSLPDPQGILSHSALSRIVKGGGKFRIRPATRERHKSGCSTGSSRDCNVTIQRPRRPHYTDLDRPLERNALGVIRDVLVIQRIAPHVERDTAIDRAVRT
jgi:hypothetical protein